MSKNLLYVGVAVLLLLAAGGGFMLLNNKAETTNTVVEPVQVEAQNGSQTPVSGQVKEFVVDGNNFEFGPRTITVNNGDTVKITFKDNEGMHNLVIDGYNVKTKIIKGGAQDTIQFVADKAGSFEYYCSVANHKEQGMTGTLIVN